MEGRMDHGSMVESVQLVQENARMAGELHQAPHVGVLLVPAEKLKLSVAAYQQHRWAVRPHVRQRRRRVYGWLQRSQTLHFPMVEVRHHLSAERSHSPYAVGVDADSGQPRLVECEHSSKVSSGRMPGNVDPLWVPSVFTAVSEGPCDSAQLTL